MQRSTVITLLIVAGLGGLALWWYFRKPGTTEAAQPLPSSCGSGVMGSIGQFIKGHVDRKNKVAPTVIGNVTGGAASGGTAGTIAAWGDKLSISNKVESWIGDKVGGWFCDASLPGWGEIKESVKDYGIGFQQESKDFGVANLKAGTVGPVKSLASAGRNLVNGNFGDAAKDVAKSVYEGPKVALSSTKDLAKAIIPGW